MKLAHLPLTAALAMAVSTGLALAQEPVAPPASAASAASAPPPPKPPEPKPGPRVLSPAESRENGNSEDLRPERPVTPQIRIPLGKTPPGSAKPLTPGMKRNGGIDDAAARCEAQAGEQVRVKCRDKLAHGTGNR